MVVKTHSPVSYVPLSGGNRLAVAEYGDPAGRPLVFLHGTPGSHLLARLISDKARDYGFRVLAPDRPGLGYSDPQPARTFLSYADDLAIMLAHFGIKQAALVGISGGGPYTLAVAHRHADLWSKVALLSPWWFPHGAADAKQGINPMFKTYAWLMENASPLTRGMAWLGHATASRWPEKLVENFIHHAPPDDKRLLQDQEIRTLLAADIAMSFRQGWRGPWRETQLDFLPPGFDVADITLPIPIWHGANDNVVPLHYVEKLATRLKHGMLHIEPEGGHFVAIRLQDEVFGYLVGA